MNAFTVNVPGLPPMVSDANVSVVSPLVVKTSPATVVATGVFKIMRSPSSSV